MKLVTVVKLSPEHPGDILRMMERFNAACNALAAIAFEECIFNWLALQKRAYHWLRERHGLSAAQAVVAIRKVAYVYSDKEERTKPAKFSLRGAIPVYRHSYKDGNLVRLYSFTIPFETHPGVSLSGKNEAKLIYDRGQFVLHQVIEVEEETPYYPTDFIGCDLGMVNLLTDSNGNMYSGEPIRDTQRRYSHRRRNLQKKGAQSSRRKLRLIAKRQARFQRDANHVIAKRVVAKAKDTRRGIAWEELKHIRQRITAQRRQRARLANWGFAQLRAFLGYKAALSGVPVVPVDPRHTSQRCPSCGCVSQDNRPTQSTFRCIACGFAGAADTVAAWNIRARARGDAPVVAA